MAQAAETNTTNPLANVTAIDTAATNAFLDRPVFFFRRTARDVLRAVAGEHVEITRPRRECIEDMLDRLEDLRQRLISRLDALDADPDLEPFLSAFERWDQRRWTAGVDDDRECGDDLEPYLSANNAVDQRTWSQGGATDNEWEHDGKEPSMGWGEPAVGTPTPWLTDGGLGTDAKKGRP